MVFSSISLRSVTFGVVLAASTGFAFASVRPINPMPQVPGNKVVASARPINPMPQVPTGKSIEPSIAG